MLRIVIKRPGVSNLPAFVLDKDTVFSEVQEMMDEIVKSPNLYSFEIVGEFVWNEDDTFRFKSFVSPLMRMAEMDAGGIAMIFGFLQSVALIHD